MRFGPWEIGLVLIIILIVFGVGKLPQVGESLGRGIRSFKKASSGQDEEESKPAQAVKPAATEADAQKARIEALEAKLKAMDEASKKS